MYTYIKSIYNWISNNSLSLNPTNRNLCIHLPSPKFQFKLPHFNIVNNNDIVYYDNVKYIGFNSTYLYLFIVTSQICFAL